MRISYAAALASVGWYLMVPPSPNTHRPITEWFHLSSHDTAEDCETSRVKLADAYKNDNSEKEKQVIMSECIATDDPRLKSK
jgi:hypothetical protein